MVFHQVSDLLLKIQDELTQMVWRSLSINQIRRCFHLTPPALCSPTSSIFCALICPPRGSDRSTATAPHNDIFSF